MRSVPFLVAIAVSLVVMFTPGSGVPSAPPGTDKVIHLLVFALLSATGRWAGLRATHLLPGLVVYAGASEILQALLPIGRSGDILDALVDVVGALVGVGIHTMVARRGAPPAQRRG